MRRSTHAGPALALGLVAAIAPGCNDTDVPMQDAPPVPVAPPSDVDAKGKPFPDAKGSSSSAPESNPDARK